VAPQFNKATESQKDNLRNRLDDVANLFKQLPISMASQPRYKVHEEMINDLYDTFHGSA
jgi:hypothetical protein